MATPRYHGFMGSLCPPSHLSKEDVAEATLVNCMCTTKEESVPQSLNMLHPSLLICLIRASILFISKGMVSKLETGGGYSHALKG